MAALKNMDMVLISWLVLQMTSVWVINGDANRISRMRDALSGHFGSTRHHVTNFTHKSAVKNFIKQQMQGMGLTVVEQVFRTNLSAVNGINVIGILKGQHYNTSTDDLLALGAHYDTVRSTPGVNNNGGGMVALLEVARALSNQTHRNTTLLFIALDFEEYEFGQSNAACVDEKTPCAGSRMLVKDWLPTLVGWPARWHGIVILDTILNFNQSDDSQFIPPGLDAIQTLSQTLADVRGDNYRGDFLAVIGRNEDRRFINDFKSSWTAQGQSKYEIEILSVPSSVLPLLPDLLRGAHFAFLDKNVSAIMLTDTSIYRGYMRQCVNTYCDNISHVTNETMGFLDKTTGSLINFFIRKTNGTLTAHASKNSAERAKLQGWMCMWLLLMAMSCCF